MKYQQHGVRPSSLDERLPWWKLKLTLALGATIAWLVAVPLWAWYYVVSILSSPEPYDAYAMNWQFQLMMFAIFRLPYAFIALLVINLVIFAIPFRRFTSR